MTEELIEQEPESSVAKEEWHAKRKSWRGRLQKDKLPLGVDYAILLYLKNRDKFEGYTFDYAIKVAGKGKWKNDYSLKNPLVAERLNELEHRFVGKEEKGYTEDLWIQDVRSLAKCCIAANDRRVAAECFRMLGENTGALGGKTKAPVIKKQQNVLITSGQEAIDEMKKKVVALKSAVAAGTAIVDDNE